MKKLAANGLESIEWWEGQCYHLRQALNQTCELLTNQYAQTAERDQRISELEAKIKKLEESSSKFKTIFKSDVNEHIMRVAKNGNVPKKS